MVISERSRTNGSKVYMALPTGDTAAPSLYASAFADKETSTASLELHPLAGFRRGASPADQSPVASLQGSPGSSPRFCPRLRSRMNSRRLNCQVKKFVEEPAAKPEGSESSGFRFVESGWFQCTAAVIIIGNIVTMVVETDDPKKKDLLFPVDEGIMVFYVLELFFRAMYFRSHLLCSAFMQASWNWLDVVVVGAGVLDQWLMPFFPREVQEQHSVRMCLYCLRILRILRVMKIIRIFLESDLSWTEKPMFQSFIGLVIGFNSLLMGMETDVDWFGWFYIEQVLLTIYVFELSVRLKSFGLHFMSSHNPDIVWNVLDFVIVVSSVMDTWVVPLAFLLQKVMIGVHKEAAEDKNKKSGGINIGQVMMLMRMLRLMRILRLVKLIKSIRPLYILVTGVVAALQGVMWVLVLTVTVLYAMGIVATRLIGHGMLFPPGQIPSEIIEPFATVTDSMFTLFRAMSGASSEDEARALDSLMEEVPSVKFGFIFFMISSSWTLLSILTAVVSENMLSTTGKEEEEMRLASDEEDRAAHLSQLQDLFIEMDSTGDGTVTQEELDAFLHDKENSRKTARMCRVPVRDVKEVLSTLDMYGTVVNMSEFCENLVDVKVVATEKSIMKLEARLTLMQRDIAKHFQDAQVEREEFLAAGKVETTKASAQVERTVLQHLKDYEARSEAGEEARLAQSEEATVQAQRAMSDHVASQVRDISAKLESSFSVITGLEAMQKQSTASLHQAFQASVELTRENDRTFEGLCTEFSNSQENKQKATDRDLGAIIALLVRLEAVLVTDAFSEPSSVSLPVLVSSGAVHREVSDAPTAGVVALAPISSSPSLAPHGSEPDLARGAHLEPEVASQIPLRSLSRTIVQEADSQLPQRTLSRTSFQEPMPPSSPAAPQSRGVSTILFVRENWE